ncbi:MAG: NAD-dependent deacylase [Prevotellaceae bacterium]|jgi:NAD-dependent deacetylase|nr:NAD-dependent deacylase [Prevotellaceae bacterium]
MNKKKLVVLSGAGVSAESGINTFRDSGGLWEEYNIMDVASIEGWYKNPELVQKFYNARRAELEKVQPNVAHKILAELEKDFDVEIITQNIDNLHERAGSSNVLHLHGELTKARSSSDPEKIYEIGYRAIEPGEKAEDGSLLRPHVVWFGERVPLIDAAAEKVRHADIFVIVGTSLTVTPASSLVQMMDHNNPVYLIDPHDILYFKTETNTIIIKEKASTGMVSLRKMLLGE